MIATGARNLITDVPGLLVGNAQDHDIRSGTSVITAAQPFVASVHVMGGAPGTRETDLLAPDKSVSAIDALVLSGGSAFGLDACSGVMQALHDAGRGLAVGAARVPIVPGAILFDLLNGGKKAWPENPYRALGAAAIRAAAETFELGSHGAGTGAMAAMTKGGLGSASLILPDGTTVGALVAANPVGSVTTPGDTYFWAAPFERDGEFGGLGGTRGTGLGWPGASRKSAAMMGAAAQGANTTIAIVATDAPLTKAECHRVSVAAHDGIARAIVPAHTPNDGDIVFALSTGTHSTPADVNAIGHAASLCLARAIARGIYHATARPGDLLPTWHDLNPGNG